MHQQLGSLTAKVDMLLEAVRRSEEKSDVSRASVYRKMDDISERVSKVETSLAGVQEDVAEMKPTVDQVEAWQQRGVGALFVVGVGASAVTFVLTQYMGNIFAWFGKS